MLEFRILLRTEKKIKVNLLSYIHSFSLETAENVSVSHFASNRKKFK
jgi:hypothetical protein